MTSNTTRSGGLQALVDAERNELPEGEDGRELQLLGLRAAVKPSSDHASVAKALGKFLKEAEKDEAGKEILAGYISDTRQPNWARLAAALVLGDIETLKGLANATLRLAERTELQYTATAALEAIEALGPVRRMLLHSAGIFVKGAHLPVEEVIPVMTLIQRTSWKAEVKGLEYQIQWEQSTLGRSLEVIAELRTERLVGEVEALQLLVAAGNAHKALQGAEREEYLKSLLAAFETENEEILRRGIHLNGAEELAPGLLGSTEKRSVRLGAAIAKSQSNELRTVKTVRLLAANDESAWVLPELLRHSEGELVLAALDALLDRVSPETELVTETLKLLQKARGHEWWAKVGKLRNRLKESRWALPAMAAVQIAKDHGYTHGPGYTIVNLLPEEVRNDLVRYNPEKLDGAAAKWKISWETLDKAQAVLVERGYSAPAGVMISGFSGHVMQAIRFECLAEVRGSHGSAGGRESFQLLNSWAKALPAAALLDLAESAHSYVVRCKAGDEIPRSIRTVIEEALAEVHAPTARAALLAAMDPRQRFHGAPYDQTLAQYARALQTAAERNG